MPITAEEWELLSFFEAEPKVSDPASPWFYNTCTYSSQIEGNDICCVLSPAYGDIRLRVERTGTPTLNLEMMGVDDLRIEFERGSEIMVIEQSPQSRTEIEFKPHLWVRHVSRNVK